MSHLANILLNNSEIACEIDRKVKLAMLMIIFVCA